MKAEVVKLVDVMPEPDAAALAAQANQTKALVPYQNGSITSEADAKVASERLILIRTVHDALDGARTKLKAPHLKAGQRVDAAFRPYLERCKNLDASIVAEMKRWGEFQAQRAEKERLEAERARRLAEKAQAQELDAVRSQARQEASEQGLEGEDADWWEKMALEGAQEAAAPLPAVPEPQAPPTKIQTSLGAAQWVPGPWTFEVQDVTRAPDAFWRVDPVKVPTEGWTALAAQVLALDAWRRPDEDALRAAVAAGVREIPGVRIYQQQVLKRGR